MTVTYVVRFDFDCSPVPTETWLDDLEDRLGHVVSARAGRGYAITVWLDAATAVDAVKAAAARLESDAGWTNHGSMVAVSAQSRAEYEAATTLPSLPAILGAADVADLLGVSRQRVHQLAQTAGFPSPIARIKLGPLWDETAIRSFERRWERKPGRTTVTPATRDQPDRTDTAVPHRIDLRGTGCIAGSCVGAVD